MINTYLESILNNLTQEKRDLKRMKIKLFFKEFELLEIRESLELINELTSITKEMLFTIKKEQKYKVIKESNQFYDRLERLVDISISEDIKHLEMYRNCLSGLRSKFQFRDNFSNTIDVSILNQIEASTSHEILINKGKRQLIGTIERISFDLEQLNENSEMNVDLTDINAIREKLSFIEQMFLDREIPKEKEIKTHNLKTELGYFEAVLNGSKRFEIRKNDRNYQIGDYLLLQEWDPKESTYTGRSVLVKIIYMSDFKQKEGYVVLSIEVQ